jgi:hypothetical protein
LVGFDVGYLAARFVGNVEVFAVVPVDNRDGIWIGLLYGRQYPPPMTIEEDLNLIVV